MEQYFATVARGLETLAAAELEQLGASEVTPEFTGVRFSGDRALLYRVNLWGRTIFRVLVPVREFPCRDAKQLYREVQKLSWDEFLTPEATFAVVCTGSNSQLNHSHFSALQVKNAIVDWQREKYGYRSNIDTEVPDLWINIHIRGDRATLSFDSSGTSLHRRGYRPAMGQAPLKETLAAALLDMTQWQRDLPLLDPLCGSGTLLLEAGLKALQIAPGLFREQFAFERWPDFDAPLWEQLKTEAKQQQKPELLAPILGSDRDFDTLEQARFNARSCGLADHIQFRQRDLTHLEAPSDRGIIICNPPYGKRLGDSEELKGLYRQLGDIFKQRFKGWTAYILTGSKALSKCIGLRTSRRLPVYNGSLPCTLLEYELY